MNSHPKSSQQSPILFWSLHFLIGCGFALHPHWIYLLPLILLATLSKRKLQGWVFLIAGIAFCQVQSTLPTDPELTGQGTFSLESIQPAQSPFKRSYSLKGTLKTFESEGKCYRNIPCTIIQNSPPKSGTKWILQGTLEKKGRFLFKPDRKIPWQEITAPFSLTHSRFQHKQAVRRYFQRAISDKRVSHFFSSIATGDIDDWMLSMEFRKLGLGHILAISGFHFALIAAMLTALLSTFLPPRAAYLILLGLLLLYFIFLGITPSILRAFIMITLYVLGLLLRRRSDPLNLLGFALLVELLINPLTITQIGFQLSFLATLGILLFHPLMVNLLQPLLPKRKFPELKELPLLDQHGSLLTTFIRTALALNLAVHLTTLPAMLFTFHQFPLLSLPYNLFLTPLLGISMMLLPLGILLPPLGKLNALYTGWLLKLISNPPELLNFKIFVNSISFTTVIALTSIICAIGLTKRWKTS